MIFFRKMSEEESKNAKESMTTGFFVYAFLLLADSVYARIYEKSLLSSFRILVIGLVIFYGYEAFLNVKNKVKQR